MSQVIAYLLKCSVRQQPAIMWHIAHGTSLLCGKETKGFTTSRIFPSLEALTAELAEAGKWSKRLQVPCAECHKAFNQPRRGKR
ncbi:MAG: hypothetical protein ACTHLZ_17830 [Tepidisphaeraceae bacterium]